MIATRNPCPASAPAQCSPAGPAPMITTSYVEEVMACGLAGHDLVTASLRRLRRGGSPQARHPAREHAGLLDRLAGEGEPRHASSGGEGQPALRRAREDPDGDEDRPGAEGGGR